MRAAASHAPRSGLNSTVTAAAPRATPVRVRSVLNVTGPVGASSAWDRSKGDGITIAILDSGVDASHPDLTSKVVDNLDFTDDGLKRIDAVAKR